MKILKLAIIIALVSASTMTTAENQKSHAVKLLFSEAVVIPGMMEQMFLQLDDNMLMIFGDSTSSTIITATVWLDNVTYHIHGTIEEWEFFWGMAPGGNELPNVPEF